MPVVTLSIEPLTAQAFAPFGDVLEVSAAARRMTINEGFAERYHQLAEVDAVGPDAKVLISIFRAQPRALPLTLSVLERHPLGSQAFMPLSCQPYLVVVAPGKTAPDTTRIRCFLVSADQGVNYARGTWHHPLLSLNAVCDFLVVDRGGPGNNLEESALPAGSFCIGALPEQRPAN